MIPTEDEGAGSHVFVALTPHEARLLVLLIDDAQTDSLASWTPMQKGELLAVRADIMDGLKSLYLRRVERGLTEGEARA